MAQQTVLPYKIEITRDIITPHAGLALLGEFAVGLGFLYTCEVYDYRVSYKFLVRLHYCK